MDELSNLTREMGQLPETVYLIIRDEHHGNGAILTARLKVHNQKRPHQWPQRKIHLEALTRRHHWPYKGKRWGNPEPNVKPVGNIREQRK